MINAAVTRPAAKTSSHSSAARPPAARSADRLRPRPLGRSVPGGGAHDTNRQVTPGWAAGLTSGVADEVGDVAGGVLVTVVKTVTVGAVNDSRGRATGPAVVRAGAVRAAVVGTGAIARSP